MHHHEHDEHCDCGHDHHEHDAHCGCGHDHHVHDEHCGCGHEHHEIKPIEGMSILQQNMLLALYERHYLPVASFVLAKSDDEEVQSIALAPVYLGSSEDTMEQVKAIGAELTALEDAGLISLDYDILLQGYPYAEYETATLYAYFAKTVEEAKGKPDFLFDTPRLEKGSMALTEQGREAVEAMLAEAE